MERYKKHLIDPALLKDVDEKKDRIVGHPSYHFKRYQKLEKGLRTTSELHSFIIEHPELKKEFEEKQGRSKEIREGVGRISDAWCYLNKEVNNVKEIREEHILETARLIDPFYNKDGYRTDRKTLNMDNYTPPSPQRVGAHIQHMVSEIKIKKFHPVVLAGYLHLRVAGTQAFNEGNKRLSRILQNKVLHDYKYPPVIITNSERELYLNLLERALAAYGNSLNGHENGEIYEQSPFYTFIATKLNASLDGLIEELGKKKMEKSGSSSRYLDR